MTATNTMTQPLSKVTITLAETIGEDGQIKETMQVDYEPAKDDLGNVIVQSNVLGMARTIQELIRCGALHALSMGFIPASYLEQKQEEQDESN